PQEVVQQGVTVKKQSPSILMVISLASPKGSYDANFLINYCGINIRDQLLRIPGIAQVDLFGGTDYGMRIWLQPDKLAKLGLTPSDIMSATNEQTRPARDRRVSCAWRPAPAPPGRVPLRRAHPAPSRGAHLRDPAPGEDLLPDRHGLLDRVRHAP